MENMKMKDHFPMVFACESNPNFEVADASFYSYGEQYDSTTEKQDSAIQHAVLNHDRLVEDNAELREVVKKMRQSHANLIELRALPNSGWYGEAQDLVDLCDSALAKHQSS